MDGTTSTSITDEPPPSKRSKRNKNDAQRSSSTTTMFDDMKMLVSSDILDQRRDDNYVCPEELPPLYLNEKTAVRLNADGRALTADTLYVMRRNIELWATKECPLDDTRDLLSYIRLDFTHDSVAAADIYDAESCDDVSPETLKGLSKMYNMFGMNHASDAIVLQDARNELSADVATVVNGDDVKRVCAETCTDAGGAHTPLCNWNVVVLTVRHLMKAYGQHFAATPDVSFQQKVVDHVALSGVIDSVLGLHFAAVTFLYGVGCLIVNVVKYYAHCYSVRKLSDVHRHIQTSVSQLRTLSADQQKEVQHAALSLTTGRSCFTDVGVIPLLSYIGDVTSLSGINLATDGSQKPITSMLFVLMSAWTVVILSTAQMCALSCLESPNSEPVPIPSNLQIPASSAVNKIRYLAAIQPLHNATVQAYESFFVTLLENNNAADWYEFRSTVRENRKTTRCGDATTSTFQQLRAFCNASSKRGNRIGNILNSWNADTIDFSLAMLRGYKDLNTIGDACNELSSYLDINLIKLLQPQ